MKAQVVSSFTFEGERSVYKQFVMKLSNIILIILTAKVR
jgi:hypothetical protein